MIPILLSGTTIKGFLQEAISCSVTEERNGIYELTMEYPVTGQMFSEIAVDRLLKAKPNDTADLQLFKIYEITKPINGIGFIIGENTPDILLSEDKKHIDLYTVISLNWKATQEILSRLEALEGGTS